MKILPREQPEPVDRNLCIYRLQTKASDLGALVKKYRFQKSLLVYSPDIEQKLLDEIENSFICAQVEYAIYLVEEFVPTYQKIDDGYSYCLLSGCDSVVAIGNKTAVDTGKGINMLRFNGGRISRYTDPQIRRNPGSGLFCICDFTGDDTRRLLTLEALDENRGLAYTVECYCNYDVELI